MSTRQVTRNFKENRTKLRESIDDLVEILIYCLSLANTLDIDLTEVVLEKSDYDRKKYPMQ